MRETIGRMGGVCDNRCTVTVVFNDGKDDDDDEEEEEEEEEEECWNKGWHGFNSVGNKVEEEVVCSLAVS